MTNPIIYCKCAENPSLRVAGVRADMAINILDDQHIKKGNVAVATYSYYA